MEGLAHFRPERSFNLGLSVKDLRHKLFVYAAFAPFSENTAQKN